MSAVLIGSLQSRLSLKKDVVFDRLVPMDPLDRKIEAIRKLTEENNVMLRKMKRSMRIAAIVKIVYWVIVIGLAIGAYYFIQPYVEGAQDLYNDIDERFTAVDEEFQGNLQSFLDFFRKEDTQAE